MLDYAGRVVHRAAPWWAAQSALRRGGLLVAPAFIALATASLALAAAGGPGEPLAVEISPPERPVATPPPGTATRSVRAEEPTPEPTAEAVEERAVTSIEELSRDFGEPPDATLGRFRIPALGVDAPLGVQTVGADGTMPNPSGPSDVVWYDFSEWEDYGGAISGGANAVFSGHVDYADSVPWAGVDFRGRGVFFSLALLSPGDVIEIDVGGERLRYTVQWQR